MGVFHIIEHVTFGVHQTLLGLKALIAYIYYMYIYIYIYDWQLFYMDIQLIGHIK